MKLSAFSKNMLVSTVVNTLKRDPENGILQLLNQAPQYVKTPEGQAFLSTAKQYYETHPVAVSGIRNWVYNTDAQTLSRFIHELVSAVTSTPIVVNFLTLTSVADLPHFNSAGRYFPLVDLKNLNEAVQEALAQLKTKGTTYFATIEVTEENAHIVTSDEVVRVLVKHGARGVFYRLERSHSELEHYLQKATTNIRTTRPLFATYMKKDLSNPALSYLIHEQLNGQTHTITVKLG